MSMTQVAFLRKAEIPTNKHIQEHIQSLGYDFKILDNPDERINEDGLGCSINGYDTFFETYIGPASEISDEADWVKTELSDQDTAISFIWGSDAAAGACIGLICIALIDHCNALSYYMDEQMRYTREMLVADTPQFLEALQKKIMRDEMMQKANSANQKTGPKTRKGLGDILRNLFR